MTTQQRQREWQAVCAFKLHRVNLYDAKLSTVGLGDPFDGHEEEYGVLEYENIDGVPIFTNTILCFQGYKNTAKRVRKIGCLKVIKACNVCR